MGELEARQLSSHGFAIAIDEAVPVIEEILEDPPEKQAWLGVQLGSIDSSSAAAGASVLWFDAMSVSYTRGAALVIRAPKSPAIAAKAKASSSRPAPTPARPST